MVIAWRKQAGAKVYFRHESQMGHEIEPSTSLTNMHPQRLRQKKDVVYGLLFLLHDSADRPFTNPVKTPIQCLRPRFVLKNEDPINIHRRLICINSKGRLFLLSSACKNLKHTSKLLPCVAQCTFVNGNNRIGCT